MAESSLQVTQGAGTRVATNTYTAGGQTVHDEKMILGEASLASHVVAAGTGISTATANSHLLQLMASSSLRVRVRRIEIWQWAVATTATLMELRLYRLSSAGTGGTNQNTQPLDTNDSTSNALSMSLPTVKGSEGALLAVARPYMLQTVSASLQFGGAPMLVWDFDTPRSKPVTIQAGTSNGIAIKNVDAVAAGSVGINIWFDESSY